MNGNTNILVTQEGRDCYGNDAAAVATEISQNDDDFVDTTDGIDAARMEESAEMSLLQRARGLTDHVTGTADKLGSEGIEEIAVMERSQLAMNLIDQATGDANTIFGGGYDEGNNSALPLAPRTLGISGGAASTTTQQATPYVEGVNETNELATSASLHRTMMGGNTTKKIQVWETMKRGKRQ